ncbi:MAG TPA: hypothetical protein VD966_01525, partial [Pyrinomonadaceae bacterium]|nr:hypothetical protein [Pyrinomonadaceae bacterium]
MNGSRFRKQFVIFLIEVALIALLLYLIIQFDERLKIYIMDFLGAVDLRMREAWAEHFINITLIVLWMALAVVLIRNINRVIFGYAFRIRKGYEAPSLVRNAFSAVAFVIIFTVVFKTLYAGVDLGALFTTSAIFGV